MFQRPKLKLGCVIKSGHNQSNDLYCIQYVKVGTWKSAFSVPPFSALVTVCMYNGCQKHSSENCGFHRLIYSVFHIFILNM